MNMINLMIVDDEVIAIKGIECDIDKERLDIEELFTAFDINQAKEVLNKHRIDIILCDIEMPQGNGLELLAWVRENYPRTECIFLTCHASFDYAKQAIELGSLDYLLKPIPSDKLEAVLLKAIEKINKSSKLEEYSKLGKNLSKYQPLLVERFWLDILNCDIPSKEKAIREAAAERNISYREQEKYLPILIQVQQWNKELSTEDERLMEFALKKTAEEMLLKNGVNGTLVQLSNGTLIAILNRENHESMEPDKFEQDCEAYITACNQYFKCDLCCYIGSTAYAYEIIKIFSELYEMDKNNVTLKNKVLRLGRCYAALSTFKLPDMTVLSVMLSEGSKAKLMAEIISYMHNLEEKKQLSASALQQFQQDFLQVIHSFLKQKGIHAHQIFNDNQYNQLAARAARSVTNLMRWADYIATKAMSNRGCEDETQSVVDKAKKFIRMNVCEELTREEVSSHVFLNPDYLNRIFKKETGMSISEYMMQERFKVSQELLLKTDMPISAIAAKVGYSNFSHFAKMFKKYADINPGDFRQKHVLGKLSKD
jgi:two-component system, response regulator YesN